jgi:hypothetical protein
MTSTRAAPGYGTPVRSWEHRWEQPQRTTGLTGGRRWTVGPGQALGARTAGDAPLGLAADVPPVTDRALGRRLYPARAVGPTIARWRAPGDRFAAGSYPSQGHANKPGGLLRNGRRAPAPRPPLSNGRRLHRSTLSGGCDRSRPLVETGHASLSGAVGRPPGDRSSECRRRATPVPDRAVGRGIYGHARLPGRIRPGPGHPVDPPALPKLIMRVRSASPARCESAGRGTRRSGQDRDARPLPTPS